MNNQINNNFNINHLLNTMTINDIQLNGETLLSQAVIENKLETVKQLVANGASVNQKNQSNYTPLMIAIGVGNLNIIEFLLNQPSIDLNATNANYGTALHVAVESNREEIVSLLLGAKSIKVNVIDKDENSPLSIAAANNNPNLVKLFLDHGAKPSPMDIMESIDDNYPKILELFFTYEPNKIDQELNHFGDSPLFYAVSSGKPEIAKFFLSKGGDPYHLNIDSHSPLYLAMRKNNIDLVRYFLENYKSDVKENAYLLLSALKQNQTEIAELFIEKGGVSPNFIDSQGYSLLHRAVLFKNSKFVDFLLKNKANPYVQLKDGSNPLHIALTSSDKRKILPIIESLLKSDPALVNTQDVEGNFPLHKAAISGIKEYMDILLSYTPDINQINDAEYTPLNEAIYSRQFEVAKYLVEKGANLSIPDRYGFTPLHMAAFYGNADIITFLLQHQADPLALTKDSKKTPMHLAIEKNQNDIVETLLKNTPSIESWELKDKDGYTPFHTAVEKGNLPIAALLLPKSDINSKENQNEMPLHTAISEKNYDMMKFLIENGADIAAKGKGGFTPLHVAVSMKAPQFSAYLLKNKADPRIEDSDHFNCLSTAVDFENLEAVNQIFDVAPDLVDALSSNGKFTPLSICKNKAIAEFLLEQGVSPDRIFQFERDISTPSTQLFSSGHFALGKKVMGLEKLKTTLFIHQLKLFGHRFGLNISMKFRDLDIALTGLNNYATHSELVNSIKHSTEWIGKAPTKKGWDSTDTRAVLNALDKGISTRLNHLSNDEMIKEIMTQYNNKEIVVIPTAFKIPPGNEASHAVTVIIHKNRLIKCNRWDPQSGIEITEIKDPSKIEQAVKQLVSSYNKPENYHFFFAGGIEKMLGLKQIKVIGHTSQKSGTCSWTNSAKQAFHGTLYLYLLEKSYNEDEAEQFSKEMYKAWVLEDRINAIENITTKYPELKTLLLYPVYNHVSEKKETEETKRILTKIEKLDPEAAKFASTLERIRDIKKTNRSDIDTINYDLNIPENFKDIIQNSKDKII